MKSPFIPEVNPKCPKSRLKPTTWEIENKSTIQSAKNQELLENADFQSLFDNFYFNIENEINLERMANEE